MARFVLTPCHIREDQVVPTSGMAAVELDWPKVVELLAPSNSLNAKMTLRRLRVNAFVGTLKAPPGKPATNFLFQNLDRANRIGWLLKRNPNFPNMVEQIYRVEVALFDSKVEERSSAA